MTKAEALKLIANKQAEQGLSSRGLAKKAGLSSTSFWLIQQGQQNPKWETICDLANAVGLQVSIKFK